MSAQLTVGELVALLAACDPNLPVESEGCDCVEPAHGVEVQARRVIIAREDNWGDDA